MKSRDLGDANMCKVSIIVPVYNSALYLRECLDSLINQSIDDYEIICVNDGSKDCSDVILNVYKKMYSFVYIINHEKNLGLSAARNTGIRNATGEYILFVDSDDYILPETCNILYEKAKKTDSDVVFYNLSFLNDLEHGCIRNDAINKDYEGIYTGMELFGKFLEDRCLKVESVRQFLKRKFLLENNLFFCEGIIHEDMLFYFNICAEAKRVSDINKNLYIYRQRLDSISWSQGDKSSTSYMVCIKSIYAYWILKSSFSKQEDEYIKLYLEMLYRTYLYKKVYANPEYEKKWEKVYIGEFVFRDVNYRKISFNKEDLIKLKDAEFITLYGAGMMAADVAKAIDEMYLRIRNVVVTKESRYKYFNGMKVSILSNLDLPKNTLFVVATDSKYHNEIIENLEKRGYHNYICPKLA